MGGSKMNYRRILAIVLILVLVLGSVTEVFASTKEATASKIKLEEYTGTVKVKNASGKDVKVKDSLRLYSGYTLETKAKSTAYVSLDSKTAIKIMSGSKVTLEKSGSKINVMLEKGTIVADVSEKLDSKSTMDIYTTNSVTGIHGTGVEVSYEVDEEGGGSSTDINMLDGTTGSQSRFNGVSVTVSQGQGTSIGGGAAVVTPKVNDIVITDLNKETQEMMIVSGNASEKTMAGFTESFGLNTLTSEQKEAIVQDVKEAVSEYQNQMVTQQTQSEDTLAQVQTEANEGGNNGGAGVQVFPDATVSSAPAEIKTVTPVTPANQTTPTTPATPTTSGGDDGGGSSSGSSSGTSTTEYEIAYKS
ncbi:MAG: FecR domain-containing protein, partial [Firmicutes bacterium]|nr:FecR domain-containing protein [Bacillota bacterium]